MSEQVERLVEVGLTYDEATALLRLREERHDHGAYRDGPCFGCEDFDARKKLRAARDNPGALRKQRDEELLERLLSEEFLDIAGIHFKVLRDAVNAIFEEADGGQKCVEREKKPEELAAHIAQAQEDVRGRGMCGAIYDDPGGREVMCIRGAHTGRHFREADHA